MVSDGSYTQPKMDTASINLVDENTILRRNVADLQEQLQDSYKTIAKLVEEKRQLEEQLQNYQQ